MSPPLTLRQGTPPPGRLHAPLACPLTWGRRPTSPIFAPLTPSKPRTFLYFNWIFLNASSSAPTAISSAALPWLRWPSQSLHSPSLHSPALSLPPPLKPYPPVPSPQPLSAIFFHSSPTASTARTAPSRPPSGKSSAVSSPPLAILRTHPRATRAHARPCRRRSARALGGLHHERLVRDRRLGSAMVLADQLQPLIGDDDQGPRPPPTLCPTDVPSILSSLHPPSSDADTFTPAQLAAIAASTAITFSADHIPALVASLPAGSAAGASGWTYALLQSLFKPTNNPLMVRRLSAAFARVITCILSAQAHTRLRSSCAFGPSLFRKSLGDSVHSE